MDRYTNQNNTAPVVSALKNKDMPVKKSYFDLSNNISFDAPIGVIVPFDIIETLPDSDYEISYDILSLTKNPLVRRMLSGCTIYIHTYAEKSSDIYEGFPTFVTRGRSGKITRSIPIAVNQFTASDDENPKTFSSHRFSPSAYLGLTPRTTLVEDVSNDKLLGYYDASISGKEFAPTIGFNALPLVMYQQICVHNYMPSNLLQNNKNLFPEDEQHLKLSATVQGTIYSLSYDDDVAKAVPTNDEMADVYYADSDTPLILDRLNVRQFDGDTFNTGLPFPELVRGDVPQISLTDELPQMKVGIQRGNDFYQLSSKESGDYNSLTQKYEFNTWSPDDPTFTADNYQDHVHAYLQASVPSGGSTSGALTGSFVTQPTAFATSVTMAQLRALDVLTQFRQRMALSDGSYNELIKAQWNKSPKLHVGKPFYIGGTKQPIVFNEVVQTSESSATNPLGRTGSRAVSAGNGYIGKYHSDDYGYIMSVLTIVPDVYYTKGIDKLWSRLEQDQFHFPI